MSENEKGKSKKNTSSEDAALIDIEKLLNDKTKINWQKVSFRQFAGFKKGKVLSQTDFDKKWNEFEKGYLGGKK